MIKERSNNLTALFWVILFFLIVLINYFALANEAVRNEIIEFLLPVLERFLHQPELEIVTVGVDVHS